MRHREGACRTTRGGRGEARREAEPAQGRATTTQARARQQSTKGLRVRNSPGYLEWLKKNGLLEFAKGKARWDDDDDADIDPFSMWGGAKNMAAEQPQG